MLMIVLLKYFFPIRRRETGKVIQNRDTQGRKVIYLVNNECDFFCYLYYNSFKQLLDGRTVEKLILAISQFNFDCCDS